MGADEEKEEVETLKARVLAMRAGAHHTGLASAQSPTGLHSRDDHQATPISLDVGGTVYTASRAVLRAVPDSWLARVVNGSISLPRNAHDIRFIERDSQAFRHILLYLRTVSAAEASGMKINKLASPTSLPSSRDELAILLGECQFYELSDLEAEVSKALKAAPTVNQSTPGANVTSTTVAGVVDDTTDIYSKASRMQLEFQSVYVTISSSNGLQFTEEERRTAMAEVNARTAELQGSGFRVKAMNTGVAQDRKTKDYCMCAHPSPVHHDNSCFEHTSANVLTEDDSKMDICRYFHAVLVRNTGKRVPSANGEGTAPLPPKASQTHGSSMTSTSQSQSSHQLPKQRHPTSGTRPSTQQASGIHGSKRLNGPSDSSYAVRSADSSSLLNERQATPLHNANRSSTEGRDSSIVPPGGSHQNPAPKSRTDRSATNSGLPRTAGRTSSVPNGHSHGSHSHHAGREIHEGIDNLVSPKPRSSSQGLPAQRSASTGAAMLARADTGSAGVGKDMDGAMHHSTGATSAHAKSSNSQQVNTSSTIDSMLAAGQQQAQAPAKQPSSSTSAADVEKAHAAALANLGLPYVLEGGPRRHPEVRVFDINTSGPPKGIPREWEEGLLEGRKRPPGTPSSHTAVGPQRVQDNTSREHSKGDQVGGEVRTDDVRMAAQSAAEASVEQAKRRAAAKAKAMSGPRTQPAQHGPPMHQLDRERGPKSVRSIDMPATTDIMRSKSDLHLHVREAKELRPPRPSMDLTTSAALSEAADGTTDDISGDGARSRHRFRLPPSIGRVFGSSKRDSRRSASVTALADSSALSRRQNSQGH